MLQRAYSCDDSGGNVRIVWLARGPALCSSNDHAHCKSRTRGIAFHNLCSSAILSCILGCVYCVEPIGVPKTLMPSGCHVSGPSWWDVGRWDATFVPHSGFALVETNSGNAPQTLCQRVIDHLDTFRMAQRVHIIEKCTYLLPGPECGGDFLQCPSSGINGSPCSPPSAWEIVRLLPSSSHQLYEDGFELRRANGRI